MSILYKSTRSDAPAVTASRAILTGLSPDGGLYVPTEFPKLGRPLSELASMNYRELAYEIMSKFFTDFTEETLAEFWKDISGLAIFDTWITADVRPGREEERWINILARRGRISDT
ncbi:MAG: hypothetical protein IKG19_02855 [Lachnospiraceae bacterium]|nr:hypothetical protein [Lachnospiraceae bacterium]